MKKETKIALVIGVLVVLGLIGSTMNDNPSVPMDAPAATEKKPEAPTKYDAYGIGCQSARERYGKGDNEFIEGIDMGDGNWMIRASTTIGSRTIFWTADLQYNPATDDWSLKGWAER